MDSVAVEVVRGGIVESTHRASVAVCDRRGRLVASFGKPSLVTFLRSSAKPFQALPLIETGAADAFGFRDEELAVAAGSHDGEPRHVKVVQRMLETAGLSEADLQCGAHPPYGKAAAERVGKGFTPLHHNCSGKHAGMLAVCVHQGWDPATYLEPRHPLQRMIRESISKEAAVPETAIGIGIDGCGAPNFAMPLRHAARAFARLSDAGSIDGPRGEALARIRDAILAHPELVAGEDRTDTRFMRAFPGDIWVKAGAEACYAFGSRSQRLGGVVKVEDGASRAIPSLLLRILEELDWGDTKGHRTLKDFRNEAIRNWAGRTVGEIRCVLDLGRPSAKVRRLPTSAVR